MSAVGVLCGIMYNVGLMTVRRSSSNIQVIFIYAVF